MPNNKTEAELALQRKYDLLRQKKIKDQKAKAAASGTKTRDQDDGLSETIDPVRQAAIEALKRKRAAAGGGGAAVATTTAPTPAAAVAAPNTADPSKPDKPSSQIKLKFVIPKKNLQLNGGEPSTKQQQPAAAPQSKKPAALDKEPAPGGQPTAKRPAIKRTAPQLPAAQQGTQHPLGQAAAPAPGAPHYLGPDVPSIPRLFVGDLPEHFTSETLFNFFSEFHEVEEAHVVNGFCYGFVTFGTYEDAKAVLDFQANQPVQVEDRHLRISWARDTPNDTIRPRDYGGPMNGGGGGGEGGAPQEHPRILAARMAAAQVLAQQDQHELEDVHYSEAPGRNLVCYDDL